MECNCPIVSSSFAGKSSQFLETPKSPVQNFDGNKPIGDCDDLSVDDLSVDGFLLVQKPQEATPAESKFGSEPQLSLPVPRIVVSLAQPARPAIAPELFPAAQLENVSLDTKSSEDDTSEKSRVHKAAVDAAEKIGPKTVQNCEALIEACRNPEKIKTVIHLLSQNEIWLGYSDSEGKTALDHAEECENIEAVKFLLDCNKSIRCGLKYVKRPNF